MEILNNWISGINDLLWSYVLIIMLLGCAFWFTFKTRFVQFRMFREMIRVLGDSANKAHEGEKHISSFQAFAVSLASRVGTGNLAGVATAIAVGGPGAVFWMWIIALLGSASAFVESTLAQLYKRKGKDSFIGGPGLLYAIRIGAELDGRIVRYPDLCHFRLRVQLGTEQHDLRGHARLVRFRSENRRCDTDGTDTCHYFWRNPANSQSQQRTRPHDGIGIRGTRIGDRTVQYHRTADRHQTDRKQCFRMGTSGRRHGRSRPDAGNQARPVQQRGWYGFGPERGGHRIRHTSGPNRD